MKTVQAILPWLFPTPEKHYTKRGNKSVYGCRDTPCTQCHKHFRATDVNEAGVCLWCVYDNQMIECNQTNNNNRLGE